MPGNRVEDFREVEAMRHVRQLGITRAESVAPEIFHDVLRFVVRCIALCKKSEDILAEDDGGLRASD